MPPDPVTARSQPTQRDVAQRSGVTQACVSMVMRDLPRVSAATRARVVEAAHQLGYRPDLALSALARRRWQAPAPATIAYVGSLAHQRHRPAGGRDRYFESALLHCTARGIRLHDIPRLRSDDAKVQDLIDASGVAGVIVGQSTLLERPLRLDWPRLHAVHCGLIVPPACGDVVCPDLPAAVTTAWRRMSARGYRRIAAVLFADPRAHSEQLLAGALLACERLVDDPRQLRVWIGVRRDAAVARRWLAEAPTDAVLGYDPEFADMLRSAGGRHPFAALVALPDRPDIAGMELPFAAVAEVAVQLLADRLRDAPGPPPQRRLHLIEMPWRDGPSLPALPSRSRPRQAQH